jgi:erythronate-4-phosphate dehydrogenase
LNSEKPWLCRGFLFALRLFSGGAAIIYNPNMAVLRILADDKIPFLRGVLEPFAEVTYLPGNAINRKDVMLADAMLVRTRTRCDRELLEGTPVKFIGTATIGFDHIDTAFCDEAGISWKNAPGCNSASVAGYVLSALLTLNADSEFCLTGKTVGIVGVGNVGTKVNYALQTLGIKTLLCDPPRQRQEGGAQFCSFEELIHRADIISMHVPLTQEGPDRTFHLIDREWLGRCRQGALFINTSRGEVAETQALKEALKSRHLAGAILDVWENEPHIDRELMELACIATPHIAGYSADGKANGTARVVKELAAYFSLDMKDWYPAAVPVPESPEIMVNAQGQSLLDVVSACVRHTYTVCDDDRDLRQSPEAFEKLRGNYRYRREFQAFSVNIKNGTADMKSMLEQLGFNVLA